MRDQNLPPDRHHSAGWRAELRPYFTGSLTKATLLRPALAASASISLTPKSVTFFVVFRPAFLDPRADFLIQMLVFETTFLVLAFANAFTYALVASRARGLVANRRAIRIINRTGGGLLIGAGVATVALASRRG